jgi:hypothetical protein
MKTILGVLFIVICSTNAYLDKKLDETCALDTDCMNSWAFCNKEKKCACIEGFVSDSVHLCKAIKTFCPSFIDEDKKLIKQTPREGASCSALRFVQPHTRMTTQESNCTSSEFCFLHGNAMIADGLLFGHCCPKPTSDKIKLSLACPLNEKTGGKCPTEFSEETCPSDSHFCFAEEYSLADSCCPLPCRGENSFLLAGTGRCMDYVYYDKECEYNAQCPLDAQCIAPDDVKPAGVPEKDAKRGTRQIKKQGKVCKMLDL